MEPSSILSNVINMPMDVIYPAVYDTNDIAFKQRKMSIRREDQLINDPIKTIRSSTFEPRPPKNVDSQSFCSSCARDCSRPEINLSFTFLGKDTSTPSTRSRSQRRERRKEGLNHRYKLPFIHCHPLPSSPNVPSLTKLKFLRYFIANELII